MRRPPWHVAETAFLELCTRCGDCVTACPAGIVAAGSGGYPEVGFARGECSFCGDCARSCRTGALQYQAGVAPWTLHADIGGACLAHRKVVCRSCGEACGAQAIRFSPVPGGAAMPQVDGALCSGCGACFSVCPAGAVAIVPAIPDILPSRRVA